MSLKVCDFFAVDNHRRFGVVIKEGDSVAVYDFRHIVIKRTKSFGIIFILVPAAEFSVLPSARS